MALSANQKATLEHQLENSSKFEKLPHSFFKTERNFIIFIMNHRIEALTSSHLSTVLINSGYDVNKSRNGRFPSNKY